MLTLKAPIQLHIGQGLTGNAEAFSQKILGNYQLLGARFAPKDLLFLLTAPPELPEELGGMTTLVSQQTQVDQRTVLLDVVNNVVNRILLDGSSQFTYQDQVYITTVLNRLGITNLEEFMSQVRQLRMHSENTLRLTRLYRTELARVIQQQSSGEEGPALPLARESGGEESAPAARDPRVELGLHILQRLESGSLYETIHAFQHSFLQSEQHIHRNELRLAEQLRLGNTLALTELKQQFFKQPKLQLFHHLNQYEAGTLLEPPGTEEAVLAQAAAAALMNVVDNTVTEVLNRPQLFQESWVHLENALWQTAENSLSRFESYHSDYFLRQEGAAEVVQKSWNHYIQEAEDFLTVYRTLHAGEDRERLPGFSEPGIPSPIVHLTRLEENLLEEHEGDQLTLTREQRLQLLNQLLQAGGEGQNLPAVWRPSGERLLYRELVRREQAYERGLLRQERELKNVLREGEQAELPQLPGVPSPGVPTGGEGRSEREYRTREQMTLLHRETAEQDRELRQEIKLRDLVSYMPGRESGAAEITLPGILEPPEPRPPLAPSAVTLTPREAEEQAPQALVETVERIDQHNRTVMQAVQRELQSREGREYAPAPDVRRTMQNALRALENPEQVLREISDQPPRAQTVHPQLTEREEALLSRADPAARALYERVLLYEKAPEAALAQGLVSPGNLGELHARLRQAEQEEPAALEHRQETLETQVQETQTLLETVRHLPGQHRRAAEPLPPAPEALRMVHKQAAPDLSEELLERLEQQRTTTTVRTESSQAVNRQDVRRMDLTQTERQIVHTTSEEITDLVNRTLARQMRTISDQVYRQMEKKLQNERARRGRF